VNTRRYHGRLLKFHGTAPFWETLPHLHTYCAENVIFEKFSSSLLKCMLSVFSHTTVGYINHIVIISRNAAIFMLIRHFYNLFEHRAYNKYALKEI